MIENGILSKFTYKNIVASGLGLGAFEWVEQFIEQYKDHLEVKDRESTYSLNLALLYFRQGAYEAALPLLQKVDTSDTLNNLNARRILLRIYYEQKEGNVLDSFLDSYQQYLYRQKNLGYHRDLYMPLVRFTRKLIRLEPGNVQQRAQLRAEVVSTKDFAEKRWVLGELAS